MSPSPGRFLPRRCHCKVSRNRRLPNHAVAGNGFCAATPGTILGIPSPRIPYEQGNEHHMEHGKATSISTILFFALRVSFGVSLVPWVWRPFFPHPALGAPSLRNPLVFPIICWDRRGNPVSKPNDLLIEGCSKLQTDQKTLPIETPALRSSATRRANLMGHGKASSTPALLEPEEMEASERANSSEQEFEDYQKSETLVAEKFVSGGLTNVVKQLRRLG